MVFAKQGPPMEDIQSRWIWSFSKSELINECDVDRTPDHVLNRQLKEPNEIRAGLVFKAREELEDDPGNSREQVQGQGRQELRILNAIVRLTSQGIELEADPRHVEIAIQI